MILKRTILVSFTFLWFAAAAQKTGKTSVRQISELGKTKSLTIGDRVPDIVFKNVLNYKNKKAKLSDFKGKLVILDLWSTYCTACIAGFPKMEALQKAFNDKIQVLLVNPYKKHDSEARIKTCLENMKGRTGFYPSMPILIHDTLLNTYFPHESIPHVVWINGERKVVAITDPTVVTEENIQLMLQDKGASLPVKDDYYFDLKKPLLVDNNGGDPNEFIYRSLFTGYKSKIPFYYNIRQNEEGEITGMCAYNITLIELIREAYIEIFRHYDSPRILLDVKNPLRFEKTMQNTYCYDLVIPKGFFDQYNKGEIFKYLQADLKHSFNIQVKKEIRRLSCLIFTAPNGTEKMVSRNSVAERELDSISIKKYIHNLPVKAVLRNLMEPLKQAFIDETNINGNIDIDFPDHFNLLDKNALMQFLADYGFAIKSEEREVDVLVITDK